MVSLANKHFNPQKQKSAKWPFILIIAMPPCLLTILLRSRLESTEVVHVSERVFPTADKSFEFNEFFDRALRPYTNMKRTNPQLAGDMYLKNSEMSDEELCLLKHFIDDYIAFHISQRNNGSRYLIFRPTLAGIGDRMGCLLYAYWLAVVSRRVFLVDWVDPFPLSHLITNARSSLNLFVDDREDAHLYLRTRFVRNSERVKYLNGTMDEHDWDEQVLLSHVPAVVSVQNRMARTLSNDLLEYNKPENISNKDMQDFRASLHLHRAVLHHVFRLNDTLRSDYERVSGAMGLRYPRHEGKSEWMGTKGWPLSVGRRTLDSEGRTVSTETGLMMSNRSYIAVHARLGKGVGEESERFAGIIENMAKAAKCLAARAISVSLICGERPQPIFLATDTLEFRDNFKATVADLSHGRVEVVTGNWNVVHSTRMRGTGQAVSDEPMERVMWGSYIDLLMLGHAQHSIALYSSFPRLALVLGDGETLTEMRNEVCLDRDGWS